MLSCTSASESSSQAGVCSGAAIGDSGVKARGWRPSFESLFPGSFSDDTRFMGFSLEIRCFRTPGRAVDSLAPADSPLTKLMLRLEAPLYVCITSKDWRRCPGGTSLHSMASAKLALPVKGSSFADPISAPCLGAWKGTRR
jgi:hypothetical protein